MEGSIDVGFNIELRALDRRSDACSGGEMYDCVRSFRRESVQNGILVSNIDCVEANVGENRLQILPFDLGIVKVVKIIDHGDRVPLG